MSALPGDGRVPRPPPRTPAGLVSVVPTFSTPQRCPAVVESSQRLHTHTLRSSAEVALHGAALPLKTLGGGQPLLHYVPWLRMGLGQLHSVLVGNLCPREQRSLRGGGE